MRSRDRIISIRGECLELKNLIFLSIIFSSPLIYLWIYGNLSVYCVDWSGSAVYINESVGIIRDAIFYGITFFNRKSLAMHPASINIDERLRLFHYNNLRSTTHVPDPPDCLRPFFYYNNVRCSVLTAYFDKYFNYFNDTIEDFLTMLQDKSRFKKFVMDYYFHNNFNDKELQRLCLSQGETVIKAAEILSPIIEIKYHSNLFYHFNEMVDTAIEFLTQLIPFIRTYHFKRKAETAETLEKFMLLENQRLARKILFKNVENCAVNFENQVYTVCYINPYIIARFCIDGRHIFILGIDWSMMICKPLDYTHVTMQSIMNSLGHPTKVEIVNLLRKKDMTISQLARAMQLARTSISRYVQDLLDELIIVKSHKLGPEIYYRLNSTYLRYAKNTFDQFLDEAIIDADKLL